VVSDRSEGPSVSPWRLRLQGAWWFALLAGFVLCLPVLLGWGWWMLLGVVLLAALVALPAAWLLRRVSTAAAGRSFGAGWLRATIGWSLALGIALAAPSYYLATITDTRPATIPQVAPSNGDKRVVFQGMQHVASENFNKAVI